MEDLTVREGLDNVKELLDQVDSSWGLKGLTIQNADVLDLITTNLIFKILQEIHKDNPIYVTRSLLVALKLHIDRGIEIINKKDEREKK